MAVRDVMGHRERLMRHLVQGSINEFTTFCPLPPRAITRRDAVDEVAGVVSLWITGEKM